MILEVDMRSHKPLLISQEEIKSLYRYISAIEMIPVEHVYIHCIDNAEIVEVNQKFLQHDYPTDIITFPYSYSPVNVEMFISLEQIDINAKDINVAPQLEQKRVFIHGLLHMCGYDDKDETLRQQMRERENFYLSSSYS